MDRRQQARRQGKELTGTLIPGLHAIDRLDLTVAGGAWAFAEDNAEAIAAHWQDTYARDGASWNGSILMAADVGISGRTLSAKFLRSDFASMMAWRDWGWVDDTVYNLFGSPVIVSRDDAVIYGVMADTTVNPGMIYPPSGSLEVSDITADGRVDVIGSIGRELYEETGLDVDAATTGELWAVYDGQRLSVARELRFDHDADELVAQIRTHLDAEADPELANIRVFRAPADDRDPLPGYARKLLRHILG